MADNEFQITLSNEQRFKIADIFDKQKVQITDYNAALIWKETFDRLVGDWEWNALRRNGLKGISEPHQERRITLSPSNAHVLVLQLLVAMQEGTYEGGDVRTMVEVIEMVREHVPSLIKLDAGEGQAGL